MKNTSTKKLLTLLCFLFFANFITAQCPDPEAEICDDFESYTLGLISAQAAHWIPWGGINGATDDGVVSDAMALSGSQSLLISEANGDDMLLLLGDKTFGTYELTWDMYVLDGNTGYFNTQKFEGNPGGEFGMQVEFFANGTATLDAGSADIVTHNWTPGTWMHISLTVDLDTDWIVYQINGVEIYAWPASWGTFIQSGTKQLGAVNFYGNVGTLQYIENVVFKNLTVINCQNFSVGTATGDAEVCFNETTSFTIEDVFIPADSIFGFNWAVSGAAISGSMDPYNEPSLLGTFGLSDTPYTPALLHDGTQIPAGTYFFTPVVFGSAVDTDGTLEGLDFTNGCVETGTSIEVTLLPDYPDLSSSSSSVDETIPPGNNGEASVTVSGGSGSYSYSWNNGGTTATITGIGAGDYVVTISDESGCVDDLVVTITVDVITGTNDPGLQQAIRVFPNPAKDYTSLAFEFGEAKDLTINLYNQLGQRISLNQLDHVQSGNFMVDLNDLTPGIYFLNISDGSDSVVEKIILE